MVGQPLWPEQEPAALEKERAVRAIVEPKMPPVRQRAPVRAAQAVGEPPVGQPHRKLLMRTQQSKTE